MELITDKPQQTYILIVCYSQIKKMVGGIWSKAARESKSTFILILWNIWYFTSTQNLAGSVHFYTIFLIKCICNVSHGNVEKWMWMVAFRKHTPVFFHPLTFGQAEDIPLNPSHMINSKITNINLGDKEIGHPPNWMGTLRRMDNGRTFFVCSPQPLRKKDF